VFSYGGDPVKDGFVASLNGPGGNLTGMITLTSELLGKRLELLLKMIPRARKVGFLSGTRNFADLRLGRTIGPSKRQLGFHEASAAASAHCGPSPSEKSAVADDRSAVRALVHWYSVIIFFISRVCRGDDWWTASTSGGVVRP
jgi:hypothetical protein